MNTLRVSNGLDPDQDLHNVCSDLGPNCLQRLSTVNKSLLARKELILCMMVDFVCFFVQIFFLQKKSFRNIIISVTVWILIGADIFWAGFGSKLLAKVNSRGQKLTQAGKEIIHIKNIFIFLHRHVPYFTR